MELLDVTAETEATFLRCLHDEAPDDPRIIALRREWFRAGRDKGLRAKVLKADAGEIIALCQYMPVEATHIVGRDLMAILCVWVHGYEHHVGNRQRQGHGRLILNAIEEDARAAGSGGVVAWGMDFPYWNPVSFYEHIGYARTDKSGMAVLVWKLYREGVDPPRFLRQERPLPAPPDKVAVAVFIGGWCCGICSEGVTAGEAVEGLSDVADYLEVDTSDRAAMLSWGISAGVYLEGKPYRPYEHPFTSAVLRHDILEIAAKKMRR
jgi:GNAT superfamily N-acetyltransferase